MPAPQRNYYSYSYSQSLDNSDDDEDDDDVTCVALTWVICFICVTDVIIMCIVSAANSEANTKRILDVEQCFGSSGQVRLFLKIYFCIFLNISMCVITIVGYRKSNSLLYIMHYMYIMHYLYSCSYMLVYLTYCRIDADLSDLSLFYQVSVLILLSLVVGT